MLFFRICKTDGVGLGKSRDKASEHKKAGERMHQIVVSFAFSTTFAFVVI